MKLFISLAGLLLLAAYSNAATCGTADVPTEENPCVTEADVLLLFDSSSSILAENYQKQFDWAKSLMRRFAIDSVRFAGVIFSHTVEKLFDLKDNLDIDSLDAAVTNVNYLNSSTYLHLALFKIDEWDMFSVTNGGRDTANKFIILLTDGNPNRLASAYYAADNIKSKGIVILGVAVGYLIYEDVIANLASTPQDVFQVASYDDLSAIEGLVAARTCEGTTGEAPACMSGYIEDANGQCQDVNECTMDICEEMCKNTQGSYICSCPEGQVVNSEDTDKCDDAQTCTYPADIVLVFDASLSIGADNFQLQRDVAKRFVAEVGIDVVQFAGVVFSRLTTELFGLGQYNDIPDLQAKLQAMNYDNSSTYLHTCFQLIDYYNIFGTDNGGREGVSKSIIVFTDGNPNRISETIGTAQVLKDQGIKIVGVPIGDQISMDIMEQIVSSPPEDYIIAAESYDTLQYVNQRLASVSCQ